MKLLSTERPKADTAASASNGARKPALRLESFLPYQLSLAAARVSERLSRLYGERCGFGNPEWRVVSTLGQYGRMTAKEIGAHSHMDKTKVSRAVAHLFRRRYLRRESNREDRRAVFLSLTERGREVYDEIAPLAAAFADGLLDGIDKNDRAAFERVIRALTMRAEED